MENLNVNVCPKCGTRFMEGKHYWAGTGKAGNPLDLAGLVCNKFGDNTCINPCRGKDGGDTWEKRDEFINKHMNDKTLDKYKEY